MSVIVKIQKLLSLSQNNTSAEEAATAYEQAARLAFKHKVNLLEIGDAETLDEKVTERLVSLGGKRASSWKTNLLIGLCKINSCKMFTRSIGSTKICYVVVGHKSDQDVTDYFFESIIAQIETLTSAAMAKRNGGRVGAKTFAANFKHGCVETVLYRMSCGQKKEEQALALSSSAMVLVGQRSEAVEFYVSKKMRIVRAGKGHSIAEDGRARELGRAAGHQVALNSGLAISPPLGQLA